MLELREHEILSLIEKEKTTDTVLVEKCLYVRIKEYVPCICTAIHAGSSLRDSMEAECLLSRKQRLQEEDPFTDRFIQNEPITLIALDSRYEYDLNRAPEECIYDIAWGQKVWKHPIDPSERAESLRKHSLYYRILHSLIQKIEMRFGKCIVFDVHSYNWKIRTYPYAPVFNIGTFYIEDPRWKPFLNISEQELGKVQLPDIATTVARNAVFSGKGHQAQYVSKQFNNTLLIPLEIKKVYMDEETGFPHAFIIDSIAQQLPHAVKRTYAA